MFYELFTAHNPFSCKHTRLKSRNQGTRRGRITYKSSIKVPDSAKVIIESMLCNKPPAERLHGFSKVLDVERFEFWRLFGSGIDGIEKLRAKTFLSMHPGSRPRALYTLYRRMK